MIYYRQIGSKWVGYLKGEKLYGVLTIEGEPAYYTWIGNKGDIERFQLTKMTDDEVKTLKLELL